VAWWSGRLAGRRALAALGCLVALAFATCLHGRAVGSARARFRARGLGGARALALHPDRRGGERGKRGAPRHPGGGLDLAGRPVFAEFTAGASSEANERIVLHSERVQAELARRRFAVLKADWTHRDEAIRAELARFGKAGVPLYVLWFPGAPDAPRVLPELITVDSLVDALAEQADGA
jgi:thiol:disulfide interchange protein DsbD